MSSCNIKNSAKCLFGPTLDSIYRACLLDLSMLHFTVVGASGDCPPTLAFLKLLRSIVATAHSLGL